MGLSIVRAQSEDEKQSIFAFRYRIYVEELGIAVPDADHERRVLADDLHDVSVSFALVDDGEVVGTLRATWFAQVPDTAPLVRKFAMEPAVAAVGLAAICTTSRFMLDPRLRHGTAIFRLIAAVYDEGCARGVRLNYGDCSPHLVPFYEHLGYRRYTRAYNDTIYGFKVPILMVMRDRTQLERVRSPLARLAAHYPDDGEARAWFAETYREYADVETAELLPEGVFFDLLAERIASDPLRSVALLRGLDRAEAEHFLAKATIVKAAAGDRIVRRGELGDALFVLLSGVAEVTLDHSPTAPIALLGAGDAFGEISLLTLKPATANVVARAACELVVLSDEFINRFLAKEPVIAAKVLLNLSRVLAERVAELNRRRVERQ